MQLTQEFKMHFGDMRVSVAKLRKMRFPNWAVIGLVMTAFVAGWSGGVARGIEDGNYFSEIMSALKSWAVVAGKSDGQPFLSDRFFAQDVDRLVLHHIRERDTPLSRKLSNASSPTYWRLRSREQQMAESVMRYAEQRLALLPTPTAETMAELKALNRLGQADIAKGDREDTARSYSQLLGREIKPEQLVTDAQLREFIFNFKRS